MYSFLVTSIVATSIPLVLKQAAYGAVSGHPLKQAAANCDCVCTGTCTSKNKHNDEEDFVPIAISGNNNVYLVWPSNKTTPDFEIMFKALTDGGKTFEPKINLSNSTGIDSERPEIAAFGNNVYVTWWERNQTSNEPVLGVSNDSGKTFGEKIMLSAK